MLQIPVVRRDAPARRLPMTNDKIVKKDFSTDESGLMRARQLKSGMIQPKLDP
jgi:hypothetical protein